MTYKNKSYEELIKCIEAAESYKKKCFDGRAERNRKWYAGNYGMVDRNNRLNPDIYPYSVNFAYVIARTIASSIYGNTPQYSFMLKSDTKGLIRENLEHFLELATKQYLEELNQDRTNRLSLTDAVLTGFGCTKLGYNIELDEETAYKVNESDVEEGALVDEIDTDNLVKKNEPYLLRVDPLNIIIDPNAASLDRSKWVCQIAYKCKEEVEEEYNLKPGTLKSGVYTYKTSNFEDDKGDKVKLYEFHDLNPENPMIYIICDGYNKIIEKKQHPLWDEKNMRVKNMFQFLWFNDSLDGIYPISDIDLVESQINEANDMIKKRVELNKKNSRIIVLQGNWNDEEVDALQNKSDGGIITATDPNARVSQLPLMELGMDYYNNIAAIRSEIFEVLGLTDYQVGGQTQQRKATEAQLIEQARKDRVSERINILEDFIFTQVDTFVELMKEYQITDKFFSISLGSKQTIHALSSELLQTIDMDINVVPGSTVFLNRDTEVNRVERLFQAMAVVPNLFDSAAIATDWLRKLGFRNPEKYLLQQQNVPFPEVGLGGTTPAMAGFMGTQGIPSQTPMAQGTEANTSGGIM